MAVRQDAETREANIPFIDKKWTSSEIIIVNRPVLSLPVQPGASTFDVAFLDRLSLLENPAE